MLACDVVRVGVMTIEMELTSSLSYSLSHLYASQPIDLCATRYQHLSDLDLADSSNDEPIMEVDMLIGSNYYWDLTTGETCRGESGPVTIRTKLGWVPPDQCQPLRVSNLPPIS